MVMAGRGVSAPEALRLLLEASHPDDERLLEVATVLVGRVRTADGEPAATPDSGGEPVRLPGPLLGEQRQRRTVGAATTRGTASAGTREDGEGSRPERRTPG